MSSSKREDAESAKKTAKGPRSAVVGKKLLRDNKNLIDAILEQHGQLSQLNILYDDIDLEGEESANSAVEQSAADKEQATREAMLEERRKALSQLSVEEEQLYVKLAEEGVVLADRVFACVIVHRARRYTQVKLLS